MTPQSIHLPGCNKPHIAIYKNVFILADELLPQDLELTEQTKGCNLIMLKFKFVRAFIFPKN